MQGYDLQGLPAVRSNRRFASEAVQRCGQIGNGVIGATSVRVIGRLMTFWLTLLTLSALRAEQYGLEYVKVQTNYSKSNFCIRSHTKYMQQDSNL